MRFAKPFTVTLASAALIALPFAGSALADGARPQPAPTAKAPHAEPAQQVRKDDKHKDARRQAISLKVAVNPSRVRAGSSYGVTILVRGLSSGTAVVTSPEGKSYRVSLSDGRATKKLTVPSRTRAGSKTVTVKVGNKTATADFTVVAPKEPQRQDRDDRRHDGRK
ncbi:unnamed protein product [[Actinomadura] parvosata subsp. kistnae]|uniref:Bacterial Ig domain-containing protein n=1 Tax=[Actinomadura] parvosata subsp. kistnae TaxID=1909395 RepID=A0A1V0ADC6_9ACTN|nr:hypothetical protein [Nonomuraea sp. ATCC 55076]AQZ68197.1 hypothetical protein BKM31_48040 [Nonomuraea sp. ATCC 55076]SPL93405.1 unnamed protein product [Actinomadura parvosata subsp. kistnae]